MKTTLPILFGFLVGFIMFVQYFYSHPSLQRAYNLVLDWKQIVFGMMLILGTLGLIRHHGERIQRRERAWGYSAVTLGGLVAVILAGVLGGVQGGPYAWSFENVQSPMQSTIFALLAFYVASAAYRAFRARTVHATLLLVAGIVVMLGRVPIGDLLGFNLGETRYSLAGLSSWILDVPNLAAKRGILIGVGLGVSATALKILLGIERSYLGKGD